MRKTLGERRCENINFEKDVVRKTLERRCEKVYFRKNVVRGVLRKLTLRKTVFERRYSKDVVTK